MERCSVIVLNHNGESILPLCLDSVQHQGADELLVVDNASTDDSRSICKTYGVRVVSANNQAGFITGLNTALNTAKGPWVLFMQNDVQLDVGAIHTLRVIASAYGESTVFQPVLYTNFSTINHAGGRYLWPGIGRGYTKVQHLDPYPVQLFSTACFLMHQRLFKTVGPFDVAFAPAYYEDVDYALRMQALMGKAMVVPAATGTHLSTFSFHRIMSKPQLSDICRAHRKLVVQKHYRGLTKQLRLVGLQVCDLLSHGLSHLHGDTYQVSTGLLPSPPR